MKLFNKVAAIAVGVMLATGVGAGIVLGSRDYAKAEAANVITNTLTFGSGTGGSVQSYTTTFTETDSASVSWTLDAFNTNNYGWNSSVSGATKTVKCGRKNTASVGSLYNTSSFGSTTAFTKVDLYISAVTSGKLNSIKVYGGASHGTTGTELASVTSVTASTSVPTSLTLSSTKYAFYTIAFDMASGSGNGLLSLDKVCWYKDDGAANVPVTGVTVSPASASVAVEGTTQLTATVTPNSATNKMVTWTSSSDSIATVSGDGQVTGVDVGSADITVTTQDGGFEATCSVSVTLPSFTTDTVAQAIAHANALGDNETSSGYYKVTGYVVNAEDYDSGYGNITFTIADEKDGTPTLKCFRVKCSSEVAATILKDAKVSLIGKLEKYVDKNSNVTPELINSLPSQITIIESGTASQTYVVTFAEALDVLEGLTPSTPTYDKYTIQGVVKEITYAYNNGQISFDIAATIDGTDLIRVYNLALTEQQAAQVEVGATIRVTGHLEVYNSTNELIHGESFELVSAPVAEELTAISSVTGTLSASAGGSWDSTQLTISGTVSTTGSTVVDIASYVNVSFDPATPSLGVTSVDVTITPKTGSVPARTFEDIPATVLDAWPYVGQYIMASEGSYKTSGVTYTYKVEFDGVTSSLGTDSSYTFAPQALKVLTISAASSDGEYLISFMDSSTQTYLACSAKNKLDVTTDSTETTALWTIEESNSNLVITNATTTDSGKDLVLQYNPNSGNGRFACYSSTQKVANIIPYDKTAKAGAFTEKYMHVDISTDETGASNNYNTCKGTGYYDVAKAQFNSLTADVRQEFATNAQFNAYYQRLLNWASANGDQFGTNGDDANVLYSRRNNVLNLNNSNGTAATMVVVVVSTVSVTALGGFFLLKKKPF